MNADDLSLLYLKDNKQYIHTYTITTITQCLKITEIVSFYIASEMSYVHILNGQKLIKMFKNGQFLRKPEDCCQTVLPD